MGWKSTINITRQEAIQAIIAAQKDNCYDDLSNEELTNMMYALNIGDDINLPYFGHNVL